MIFIFFDTFLPLKMQSGGLVSAQMNLLFHILCNTLPNPLRRTEDTVYESQINELTEGLKGVE